MPKSYEQQHCEHGVKQLLPLVDGTITKAIISQSRDSFGFEVRRPDGKLVDVWVDCDPEGNGPGHLNILPAS